MRRTGFKQKLIKPMKKGKVKRKSKSETRIVQDLLWEECKRIIRNRYRGINNEYYCFTCDKRIIGSGCQTGHFIPNSTGGASLRYNLDNLRLQCYHCNINLGGNGSEFYRRLVIEKGQEYVDNLFKLKNSSVNSLDLYKKLLEEYRLL